MLSWPSSLLSSITCAPGGTGKRPSGPLTLTAPPAGAELDAGLAVVVTVHAASDRPTVQAAAVSAAARRRFTGLFRRRRAEA